MHILGINAYHGNSSAALVSDGRLIAAVEEERFNRVKYAAGFPSAAIRYCLDAAGIPLSEVDHVAIPRNPWARLGTKLMYALKMPGFAREQAALLSADGLGDFASTMWGTGQGNRLNIAGGIAFPHSLGMYYTAVSQYLGFRKFGDEFK